MIKTNKAEEIQGYEPMSIEQFTAIKDGDVFYAYEEKRQKMWQSIACCPVSKCDHNGQSKLMVETMYGELYPIECVYNKIEN